MWAWLVTIHPIASAQNIVVHKFTVQTKEMNEHQIVQSRVTSTRHVHVMSPLINLSNEVLHVCYMLHDLSNCSHD